MAKADLLSSACVAGLSAILMAGRQGAVIVRSRGHGPGQIYRLSLGPIDRHREPRRKDKPRPHGDYQGWVAVAEDGRKLVKTMSFEGACHVSLMELLFRGPARSVLIRERDFDEDGEPQEGKAWRLSLHEARP